MQSDQTIAPASGLADVAIPLGIRAPRAAREIVARCLADRITQPALEIAQLLVSEMVSNSVRHSGVAYGEDVILRVQLGRDSCRLEVEDAGCEGTVAPRPPDPARSGGLGLRLVESLSERWGVIRGSGGPTRVWAQVSSGRPVLVADRVERRPVLAVRSPIRGSARLPPG